MKTNSFRRRLRPRDPMADIRVAVIKSLSVEGVQYTQKINVVSGAVECDCPHFQYRFSSKGATIETPQFQCKHIKRHLSFLDRQGELEVARQKPCYWCGAADCEKPVVDDSGYTTIGWICADCIYRVKRPGAMPKMQEAIDRDICIESMLDLYDKLVLDLSLCQRSHSEQIYIEQKIQKISQQLEQMGVTP